MKKNGFTLAEVLITLAIIGVVATMTLPALMTNTQEQQAKTGLKKGINTLTEAASMNAAIDGYDFGNLRNGYGDVTGKLTDDKGNPTDNSQTLFEILSERTSVDYTKTTDQEKYHIDNGVAFTGGQTVLLRDGSAIIFGPNGAIKNTNYSTNGDDGIPQGFVVVYDTNGEKAPNVLSNCLGNATGAFDSTISESAGSKGAGAGTEEADKTNVSACEVKSKRVIKDQFTLFLRGSIVEPAGAAAIWAFNN